MRNWAIKYLNQPHSLSDDDRKFWYRRFTTSLSIGHGAALIALASYAASSNFDQTLQVIKWPFNFFSIGLFAAGITPLFIGLRNSLQKSTPRTENFTGEENPEDAQYESPLFDAAVHYCAVNLYLLLVFVSAIFFLIGLILLNINIHTGARTAPDSAHETSDQRTRTYWENEIDP